MANYKSRHSGEKIDEAVGKALFFDPDESNGWVKLKTSADAKINLGSLINPGNFTIDFFTDGSALMNTVKPLNISVSQNSGVITQYVTIVNTVEYRTLVNGTYTPWVSIKSTSFIDQGPVAPTSPAIGYLWINTSNPLVPTMMIQTVSGWVEVKPPNQMDSTIYDPTNIKGDIFAFIAVEVGKLDTAEITLSFNAHVSDTSAHVTQTKQNEWNAKETPASAEAKIDAALATAKEYVDTSVAGVSGTAGTLIEEAAALSLKLTVHVSDAGIHTTKEKQDYWDAKAEADHTHSADSHVTLDASAIVSGVIDIARIPHSAQERLVEVENDAARFALTTKEAQNGDSVYVIETMSFYFVVDETKLDVELGYVGYASGVVGTIHWANIKNKPTTVLGFGISDANTKTEVVDLIKISEGVSKKYTDDQIDILGKSTYLYDLIKANSGVTTILRGIAYGNGCYVAVGDYGTIVTSPDGITWTKRDSGVTDTLYGITTYGNGLYVAVGYEGAIVTSPDGITWTKRDSGSTDFLEDITYGNGLYVAVGYNGTILTSPDGITWTKRTSGVTDTLYGITYGNSLYVAVGYEGTILTSPDTITWTKRTSGVTNLLGITYGNGLYVSVGQRGTIVTSPDGITWTNRTIGGTDYLQGITYDNGLYVAVGARGTIATSSDGIIWTKRTSGVTDDLFGITYGNGLYVAVGDEGTILTFRSNTNPLEMQLSLNQTAVNKAVADVERIYNYSGALWNIRASKTVNNLTGVCANTDGSTIVASGNNGTVTRSSDKGVSWTSQVLNGNPDLHGGVKFLNNQFIAIGKTLYTASGTGVTWVAKAVTEVDIYGIAYAANQYVLVGIGGSIYTSPDLLTLTKQTSPQTGQPYNDIIYAKGTYIAIGNVGEIATSPDGTNWLKRISGIDSNITQVIFDGTQFVCSCSTGIVLTSTDTITWTKHITGVSLYLHSIAYNDGQYIAVSTGGVVITTHDLALPWVKQLSETRSNLTDLVRVNTAPTAMYVAVGDGGTIITSEIVTADILTKSRELKLLGIDSDVAETSALMLGIFGDINTCISTASQIIALL